MGNLPFASGGLGMEDSMGRETYMDKRIKALNI